MCDFDLFEPEPGDADYVAPTKRESAKVVYRECSDLELFEPESLPPFKAVKPKRRARKPARRRNPDGLDILRDLLRF